MLVLSKMPLYYRAAMIVSLGGLLWGYAVELLSSSPALTIIVALIPAR